MEWFCEQAHWIPYWNQSYADTRIPDLMPEKKRKILSETSLV